MHHQVSAGDAVHRRVMHLRDDGDAALGHVLDDPHLPQRPVAVERTSGDVAHDLGQLVHRARRRRADAMEMVVEIELRVLDPHGVVEVERDRNQPPAERLEQVEPRLHQVPNLGERVAAGCI